MFNMFNKFHLKQTNIRYRNIETINRHKGFHNYIYLQVTATDLFLIEMYYILPKVF